MKNEKLRKGFDQVYRWAIDHLAADGWSTHQDDELLAHKVYALWVKDTHASWAKSGYRDRELLREQLQKTFIAWYGEEGGLARVIVLSLLLEIRARRLGHVQQERNNI